uniref:Tubulin--tyrosine ligase-like protein 9 n=1 Tax=Timema monikensis TaxID=170555 RepID=A0A7R9EJN8_9NEOP|nr:unnamed protein product [Timema monikensis]
MCQSTTLSPSSVAAWPKVSLLQYIGLPRMGRSGWLIEVNASPSMSATSDEDYKLKYTLLQDVLNVLDLEGRLTGRELRVGGFDLIWDDGPVWALCPGFTSCDLVLPNNPLPQRLNIFLGE